MSYRKPMLIIGPARSGKTSRALDEAKKVEGVCLIASWENVSTEAGLASCLKNNPTTVVVEGLSLPKTRKQAFYLKRITGGDSLYLREKYAREGRIVKPPFFIFTLLTPPDHDLSEIIWRRFELLDLRKEI